MNTLSTLKFALTMTIVAKLMLITNIFQWQEHFKFDSSIAALRQHLTPAT